MDNLKPELEKIREEIRHSWRMFEISQSCFSDAEPIEKTGLNMLLVYLIKKGLLKGD